MKIKNLYPQKYKRFFAFGCSFTKYKWTTWADIIGQNIPYYENWAQAGCGNHFIFNSIIEADTRHDFNQDDLVMVMWSTLDREDRYRYDHWYGNTIGTQEEAYGQEWVRRFSTDYRAQSIRDYAFIKSAQVYLESKGCDWANLSMRPLINIRDFNIFDLNRWKEPTRIWTDLRTKGIIDKRIHDRDVVETYADIFKNIEQCYEEFLSDEEKQSILETGDLHPSPEFALRYVMDTFPDNAIAEKDLSFVASDIKNRL